jgi:hypothetical protein
MKSNREYCFGIIPLKRQGTGWEVFLVEHNKGHWGFPKGEVKLLNIEIRSSKWVSFAEALNLLTFEQAKGVCRGAMETLDLLK